MTDKIIFNVISEMAEAQKVIIGGDSKKEYVMTKLKEHMDKDDVYSPSLHLYMDSELNN